MSDRFSAIYPICQESSYSFTLRSPAKVNLNLRVVGKREDGYHELDTLFQELDWADELEFSVGDDFELVIEGAELAGDGSNLIAKAAKALAIAASLPCQAKIRLKKNLPLQGGLGGGSSNASVTLLGLNRLWGLNWRVSDLEPIAAKIGADCPFFLHGGLAIGSGRGDKILPLNGAAPGTFLLIIPEFGVETAWAFSSLKFPLTEVEKNVIFSPLWLTGMGGTSLPRNLRNDLENIVFRRYQSLKDIREQLIELGAEVSMMSGSGSTVFGIFESDEIAQHAARELSTIQDLRVKVCRAIARR